MREAQQSAVRLLYRGIVWIDAYRVRVFSSLTVVAAVAYWLTGSGFLQFVALASLIMVLVNLGQEALRRWGSGRHES